MVSDDLETDGLARVEGAAVHVNGCESLVTAAPVILRTDCQACHLGLADCTVRVPHRERDPVLPAVLVKFASEILRQICETLSQGEILEFGDDLLLVVIECDVDLVYRLAALRPGDVHGIAPGILLLGGGEAVTPVFRTGRLLPLGAHHRVGPVVEGGQLHLYGIQYVVTLYGIVETGGPDLAVLVLDGHLAAGKIPQHCGQKAFLYPEVHLLPVQGLDETFRGAAVRNLPFQSGKSLAVLLESGAFLAESAEIVGSAGIFKFLQFGPEQFLPCEECDGLAIVFAYVLLKVFLRTEIREAPAVYAGVLEECGLGISVPERFFQHVGVILDLGGIPAIPQDK